MAINGGIFNPNIERYVYYDVEKPYTGHASTAGSPQILNSLFTLSCVALKLLDENGRASGLHLEKAYKRHLDSVFDYPNRPMNFVPIGDTPGSILVVIGIEGGHRGKVAAYEYMEHFNLEKPLEDVFHIANSFDDFLSSLYFMKES